MNNALDRLHERQRLDQYVAHVGANVVVASPNPFDNAIARNQDIPLAFSRSPTPGNKTVYVCFGGGRMIGIWTNWHELCAANPVTAKRFARGFASMVEAKQALKLVKVYGGLGEDVAWNRGYWVVLRGQDPGWCYGR